MSHLKLFPIDSMLSSLSANFTVFLLADDTFDMCFDDVIAALLLLAFFDTLVVFLVFFDDRVTEDT